MESLVRPENIWINIGIAIGLVGAVAVASSLFSSLRAWWFLSKYPLANTWDAEGKRKFATSAEELLRKGLSLSGGGPFRLHDKVATRLMLPTKYVDEIKSHPSLDFNSYVCKEFFTGYPGFEPFSPSVNQRIFQDAVRTQLTQALTFTIEPMAKETPNTLNQIFGPAPEWKETVLTGSLLGCVARLTSLIFLGEKFMNNPDWQKISIMYTVDAFMAAQALNNWSKPLRPFVHWFLPECIKIRKEVKTAMKLITPEVERRHKEAAANGDKPKGKVLDSVDWFKASAKGQAFDYANAELSLAMASIHTTTNTTSNIMYDLMENPEYIPLLREEIKQVLAEEGGVWSKSTLFKLKLMDSVNKESMRLRPATSIALPRVALSPVTLSDNTYIPHGTLISIGPSPMHDPEIYTDPLKFNGHRYYNLRQTPGGENKHQFVTTSSEHLVFGHGRHACPGRFFAGNEIKLLLAHLLMYYDWKLPDGQEKVPATRNGLGSSPNPRQVLLYKSRKPEVEI